MSFYFSQLIAASGVQIAQPQPPPTIAPLVEEPGRSPPDIMEIAAENAPPAPLAIPSFPTEPPPERANVQPKRTESRGSAQSPQRAARPDPASAPLEKTIIVPAPGIAPVEANERIEEHTTTIELPAAQPASAVSNSPEAPPIAREEILNAVMNWIAAATEPAQPRDDDPATQISPPAPDVAEPASAPVSPPPPLSPAHELAIPERIIMKTESVAIPARVPHGHYAAPSAPESKPDQSPFPPPTVSIGAIHLRIETPPPPPPPPRRPTTITSAKSPSPVRADRWRKLRRHYVLPH